MSVGKWFEQAGKDIGKFVTKEVPTFFTKTVPSVGKPETFRPSLIPLREKSDRLRGQLTTARTLFFDEKAKLAETASRYRMMSEDYAKLGGEDAANIKMKVIKDKQWDEAATAAQKTIKDVDATVRTVLSTATFGLTEPLWAVAAAVRAKEEVEFLKKRNSQFASVIKKINAARSQMKSARNDLEANIKTLGETNASLAELATTRNQATLDSAREDAVATMAQRLIADGVSAEQVEVLTGLASEKIAQLAAMNENDTQGS